MTEKNERLTEDVSQNKAYSYSSIFLLAFILVVGSAYTSWYTQKEVSKLNHAAAISDAEYFLSSVAQYRTYYSKAIVTAAKKYGMNITHDYADKHGALPLPATFVKDFGAFINKGDNKFKIKLYSDQPFAWRKMNVVDEFELNALKKLKINPSKPVWSFEVLNGESVLRYVKADTLSSSCVSCHNSYEGTPKTDWKVGDVRGALEVVLPMSEFESTLTGTVRSSFLMMMFFVLLMIGLLFSILKKLHNSAHTTREAYLASDAANQQLQASTLQLKANEVKLRAIVNSVEECIVVIDQKGIITECNDLVETIFGYAVDEVVGKNITLLMTGEHASDHDAYIQAFLLNSSSQEETHEKKENFHVMGKLREFYATRKNGETFPIELFVNDARVGDRVMFTGTIRDITERKKTDEVREEAHQLALESAQLKSDFLANMSHEIRTPMNGVIGMTELLLLSNLNNKQEELAQTVKESAEALLVIINDILDYSKIEAGKLEIHTRHFNLVTMIESSIDLLANEAEKKGLNLTFFIDPSVPVTIESDPVRLRQVIINLLNNALKFTEHGYVILHVESIEIGQLKFSVIDTGIGIPDENVASLFDMFSQVDSSLSRGHGGTGLGLAICKQLAELLGGHIGVESRQNAGSTFWFTIEVDASGIPETPYIIAPVKVLMLNPVHGLSPYYNKQMIQWQMKPTIVSNVTQLMSELEKEDYDLIAIDTDAIFVAAQGESGIETVFKDVRQHSDAQLILYASPIPFNLLSNLSFENDISLLSKPIKHSSIKTLFQQLSVEMAKEAKEAVKEVDSEKERDNAPALLEDEMKTGEVNYRILLAEDNRVNQMVAKGILEKFGCDVIVAENGKIAVEMAEKELFDLILMDCQMPEMDGYAATRAIRAFDEGHYNAMIPIIAFTAHAMKGDDLKCTEAGMDDYLSKPINMDELQRVLESWEAQMKERKMLRMEGK